MLSFEIESLESAADELDIKASISMERLLAGAIAPAVSTFSTVSGLDQLATQHQGVLVGSAGSGTAVMGWMGGQARWLSSSLTATLMSLSTQNNAVRRAMDIADEGGFVGDMAAAFPMRPPTVVPGFSFAPPAMVPATSVEQLAAQFAATNTAAALDGASDWMRLGASAAELAASLESVAAQVASSARGLVFDRAVAKISEVAATAAVFAANCEVMAGSVSSLVGIHQRHLPQVMAAQSQVASVVDPAESAVVEEGLLAQLNASIAADLPLGIPPIRNLTVAAPGGPGGGVARVGMGAIEGNGRLVTAGLGATGAPVDAAAVASTALESGGSFAEVASGAAQSTPEAMGEVATQSASLGQGMGHFADTVAQPLGQSVSNLPSTGASTPGVGGAHSGAQGVPVVPSAAPTSQASGLSPRSGITGTGLGVPGLGRSRSEATAGVGGALAAGGAAVGAGGLGVGALGGAHGAPGAPLGGGPRGAAPGLGAAGGQHPAQPTTAPSGARPGTAVGPMMAPGAQPMRERRNSKVKSVTSNIEKNHNLRELLGEQEPVVPRAIGAWVRQ